MVFRILLSVSVLVALGLVAAGVAGAVTISSWIGGKGATPAIVTAGSAACPGTMTTINGTGFVNDGGVTSVTIGGVPASEIVVGSDIILYARVGTGATNGSVVVTTKAGSATATMQAQVVPCASSATASVKPSIDSVAPTKAKGGKKLTLHGAGFVGMVSVTVGGTPATFSIPSDNLMYVILPSGAKVGKLPIVLTNTLGKTVGSVTKTG
jgi:hypothetical protein